MTGFFPVSRKKNYKLGIGKKFALLAISLFGFVLLLIPEAVLEISPDAAVWLTFIILISLSFIGWYQVCSMGENPWISPVFWYIPAILLFQTASIFLYYKLSVFISDRIGLEGIYNFGALQPYFPKSCLLILLGGMGVFIGLNVPTRFLTKHIPPLNWTIDEKSFSFNSLLVLPFSIISFWVVTVPGLVPFSIRQVFIYLGQLVMVIYIVSIVQIYKGTKYDKLWKFIFVLAIIGYIPSLLLGIRSAIVFPIIFFVWTYLAIKRKFSKRILICVAIFIIGFSMSYPRISYFKAERLVSKANVSKAIQLSIENVSTSKELVFLSFLQIVMSHTLAGGNIVHYVQQFPDSFPYLEGESFIVVLGELVPRFIHPEKQSAGQYINRIVYDTGLGHEEHEVASSMFIDAISEFYINFGHAGVFFLSIIQGMYLQTKYDWLIRRSNFKIGFPIYAAGFITPCAFTQMFVSDSKALIVWISALWFMSYLHRGRLHIHR